jgi:hypothetical protein
MAQVLKPTPVAQVDASGRIQAHSGGTTDFGRNLKPTPVAKLFVFSDFSFVLAFRKVLFIFLHLKSTSCGTKSTTAVASKVRLTRQSKVDFFSRNSKSALRGNLKSTSSVATQSLLRVAS